MLNWAKINNLRRQSAEKYKFYLGDYSYESPSNNKMAAQLPKPKLGWGRRAIEMRANKTHFDRFENDALGLTELAQKYHVYEALDMVKSDTLVAGCGFLALVGDRVLPFTAEEATGTYDWATQNLKSGVAVFSKTTREFGQTSIPDAYMVFEKGYTIIQRGDDREVVRNSSDRPLIGLLTHSATTKRPFGSSVLTPSARSAIIDASRTLNQSMIAAHLYNVKVDVLLGIDGETDVNKTEMKSGDALLIGTNANGQIPQIGEFAQHSMTPFSDTMMMSARNFCADTKLSLANLGISSEAPQSPEALEIVGDDLKDDIAEWHEELGRELKDFMVTLFMYDEGISSIDENLRTQIDGIVPIWRPIYRADLSKAGDALVKIGQVAPEALRARSIWRGLGLTSKEIDRVVESLDAQAFI